MHFDLTKPCANCPFRKSGCVQLQPSRVREIGSVMLARQGTTFACHKTVYGPGKKKPMDQSHCAGALIFAEKNSTATQAMRWAERLGLYDPAALMDPSRAAVHDLVCSDLDELARAHRAPQPAADSDVDPTATAG